MCLAMMGDGMSGELFNDNGVYVGDIADQTTEDGEFAWHQHLNGNCIDHCQYCTPSERRALRAPRQHKTPTEAIWVGLEELEIVRK